MADYISTRVRPTEKIFLSGSEALTVSKCQGNPDRLPPVQSSVLNLFTISRSQLVIVTRAGKANRLPAQDFTANSPWGLSNGDFWSTSSSTWAI